MLTWSAYLTSDSGLALTALAPQGEFSIQIRTFAESNLIHIETSLTPEADLLVTGWPRDLYPLDENADPMQCVGEIHAAQRGLNAGLVFFSLAQPRFGTILYLQDLTRLNKYFQLTGTKPDAAVGGTWPELGYAPPPAEADRALPAGERVVISSAFLAWTGSVVKKADLGRALLDLTSQIYPHLEKPETKVREWPEIARRTLRDLKASPQVTTLEYGKTYLHPYTDAEYPDSMVQLAVLTPLRRYLRQLGRDDDFADRLWEAVPKFYDAEHQTLRRYLPNVGDDKDPDQVDSWYLYHPLFNLGKLAVMGDKAAEDLFFKSLDYAIKAARRMKYRWPVFFDLKTLRITQAERQPGQPGQSDVGGLYAAVMQSAHHLSGEERYLEEADKALSIMHGWGFDTLYQSNITNIGAVAAFRQWQLTGRESHRKLCWLLLANGLHNSVLWESNLEEAAHYSVFLGATCLHDGPYMAIYECFESCAAFCDLLEIGGRDLPDSVRLILGEYIRYALHRATGFYPAHLPKKSLADEPRNGVINRRLAIPLEDLYADGQPAGQVGQEVYGAGAAFEFATRFYRRVEALGLTLFCEAWLVEWEESQSGCKFVVGGREGVQYQARLLPLGRRKATSAVLITENLPPISVLDNLTLEGGRHYELHVQRGK